jgi:hydrogenase/urease accessory protein HupE
MIDGRLPPHRARAAVATALLALALLLGGGAPAGAHELGTVRVIATFLHDGTYRLDLAIDTEQLPLRETAAEPLEPPPGNAAALDAWAAPGSSERARFETFLAAYLERAALSFDGRRATPERVEIAAVEPPIVTVRLSGPIPPGVRTFGWSESLAVGQYLLAVGHEGDPTVSRQWLTAGKASDPFVLARAVVPLTRLQVVRLYLELGFTHIVPKGLDHILFVLGIFLLSRRLKPVLAQVTAFTVAHTLTLALSIYGVVRLSPSIVEPLIALSIVYVAVENVITDKLKPSRVAVVFCFGLLHGLGFAGVLTQIGLPRSEFLTALLSFNVGVEAGQLSVILTAFLAVGLLWRHKPWYRYRIVVPASLLIGAVGLWWAAERTFL